MLDQSIAVERGRVEFVPHKKSFQFMYILATILPTFIVLRDTKKLNLVLKIAA